MIYIKRAILEIENGRRIFEFRNLGSGLSRWEVWDFLGIFGLLCLKLHNIPFYIYTPGPRPGFL